MKIDKESKMTLEEIHKELDELLPPLSKDHDVDAYMHVFGLTREVAERFCRTLTHEIDHDILTAIYKGLDDKKQCPKTEKWIARKKSYEKQWQRYLQLHTMEHNL
jgi:hypothetical protein